MCGGEVGCAPELGAGLLQADRQTEDVIRQTTTPGAEGAAMFPSCYDNMIERIMPIYV